MLRAMFSTSTSDNLSRRGCVYRACNKAIVLFIFDIYTRICMPIRCRNRSCIFHSVSLRTSSQLISNHLCFDPHLVICNGGISDHSLSFLLLLTEYSKKQQHIWYTWYISRTLDVWSHSEVWTRSRKEPLMTEKSRSHKGTTSFTYRLLTAFRRSLQFSSRPPHGGMLLTSPLLERECVSYKHVMKYSHSDAGCAVRHYDVASLIL